MRDEPRLLGAMSEADLRALEGRLTFELADLKRQWEELQREKRLREPEQKRDWS